MIIKAGAELRGQRLSGLLWYLYAPGKAHEHQDPRMLAAWADVGDVEPVRTPRGRHDLRGMVARMQMPLRALPEGRRPRKPVWHCVLRNHVDDPHLTDGQWATIARETIDAVGLADTRWVAVRHDDHGIHLTAVLATEDGRVPRLSFEKNRLDALRRRLEPRFCTVRTGTTRTGDRRPTRGEHEKAQRQGRAEPARATLRRAVGIAAVAADSDQSFLAQLRQVGIMVEVRHSVQHPEQITGYKVALPSDHTRDGRLIWHSGRSLGADLTWPKLKVRWATHAGGPGPASPQSTGRSGASPGATPGERQQLRAAAYRDTRRALREVSSILQTSPQLAGELQSAVADVAAAVGYAWDGPHDGRRHRPVTGAVDLADRAGRTPGRGAHRYHLRTAQNLRSTARAVALAGRVAHGDDKGAWLLVVHQVVATLEALGDAQRAGQRADQAAAARRSAAELRAEVGRLAPPAATPRDARTTCLPSATAPQVPRRPPNGPATHPDDREGRRR